MFGTGEAAGHAAVLSFTRQTMPGRVVFGPGQLDAVEEETSRLGARHALLIAGGSARPAGDRTAALHLFDRARELTTMFAPLGANSHTGAK